MESRATKEEGIVVLRITVNASGRPMDVRLLSPSVYTCLDRASQEGGIRNATAGDQFDSPLRFNIAR